MLVLYLMKKRKVKIKEISKIRFKKIKVPTFSKKINEKEPDLQKILSSKFQTLVNTYIDYRERRKIEKLEKKQ